jgi:ribosomal protein L9
MGEYRAKRNILVGEGAKADHKIVKQGETFECSEEYAKEHLLPHGLAEDPDEADERDAAAEEKEAAELEQKAAEKKAKASEKKAKVEEKKSKKKASRES